MSKRIKCAVVTNAGRECQAWAMVDSDPPRCWAHSERRQGYRADHQDLGLNVSSIYSRQLTAQERADIRALAEDQSLDGELALNRVFLRRLLVALQQSDDLDAMQLARLAPVIFRGTQAVARLLQEERALNGESGDRAREEINLALQELSRELGL